MTILVDKLEFSVVTINKSLEKQGPSEAEFCCFMFGNGKSVFVKLKLSLGTIHAK